MNYLDLSDAEVLDHASIYGPGFIGHYLFERAEWVRVHNPNGAMGRDALDAHYVPSDKAVADLKERGMWREDAVAFTPVEPLVVQPVVVKRGPGRPRKDAA